MNKDVIYIDVDDDVTAIIGKIKKANEKIVAVVPPKRAGTLQSAVNLRLLDRMAKADKKQLVLITNNQALIALASNALIPVAKNLQTKPEIAEVAAIMVDDGDDIIDGAALPVGDHAGNLKIKDATRPTSMGGRSNVIDSIDVDQDDVTKPLPVMAATSYVVGKSARASSSKIKIPNFDKFRKRLFLGIGAGILLIALLIWMFVFAPAATIIVTAATTPSPVSATVKLGGTAATDYKTGVIQSVSQSEKKDETLTFDATGTKDVGTPATGTLKVSKLSQSDQPVPAGSRFTTSSGLVFTTDKDVVVPASVPCFPTYCAQSVNVTVTAQNPGTDYNDVSGTTAGPNGTTGTFTAPTSGGTSRIAKVVSQADIDQATGQLIGQSTDAEKKLLTAKFMNGEKVIDSSFTVERAPAVSSPTVNSEASSGKATLTITTTYTIYAVATAELDSYLNSSLTAQIKDGNTQKIYDTGIKNVGLSNFTKQGDVMQVAITATGQIGPKIDENQIKQQVKGKIYGEVQSTLQQINGIQNVDVKFSYFWVRRVPNDPNKINIQFQVQNG
ncbi:MAG: hypothetical protein EOT05_00165 [Candidatus Microsaccharimonas sossegonensis]|uniref:Baseplate protein J-like barrel domain-containing protein n=1 Tax=Candidatus Microsaccharimonas sossegonensis TaxID=2506948 RepID=A0A4Q0AGA3_9BACT|nr:MAG: hypothetical protein EOT05_00165 [Candidatus Microsaccharimonas sossegonensis]